MKAPKILDDLDSLLEEIEDLDVSDFDDPDEAIAISMLEKYKELTGEDYEFWEFKEDYTWPASEEHGRTCYQCLFGRVHPDMEKIMPTDRLAIVIERNKRVDGEMICSLELIIINTKNNSSAIVRTLMRYIGSKLTILNDEEVSE